MYVGVCGQHRTRCFRIAKILIKFADIQIEYIICRCVWPTPSSYNTSCFRIAKILIKWKWCMYCAEHTNYSLNYVCDNSFAKSYGYI